MRARCTDTDTWHSARGGMGMQYDSRQRLGAIDGTLFRVIGVMISPRMPLDCVLLYLHRLLFVFASACCK